MNAYSEVHNYWHSLQEQVKNNCGKLNTTHNDYEDENAIQFELFICSINTNTDTKRRCTIVCLFFKKACQKASH